MHISFPANPFGSLIPWFSKKIGFNSLGAAAHPNPEVLRVGQSILSSPVDSRMNWDAEFRDKGEVQAIGSARVRLCRDIRRFAEPTETGDDLLEDCPHSEVGTLLDADQHLKRLKEHALFQKYYSDVRQSTINVARAIGVRLRTVSLRDPTHELPDLEMLVPVTGDHEKLRMYHGKLREKIATAIGDLQEPLVNDLTNSATSDIELYFDSVQLMSFFSNLVIDLASKVAGRLVSGQKEIPRLSKVQRAFSEKSKSTLTLGLEN